MHIAVPLRSASAPWTDRAMARLRAWAEAERGRFALFLPVLMAWGAAICLSLRAEPPVWLGSAMLMASLAACTFQRVRPAASAIAALALGFAAAQAAILAAPPVLLVPGRAVVVSGTVQSVEPLPQGRRITVAAPRFGEGPAQRRSVRIRLRPADAADLQAGDSVRVRAMLRGPAPPAYPGAWDLQRDAFFAGLGAYGYALGPSERTAEGAGGFAVSLHALREAIAGRIGRALPGAEGAVATTLLTGLGGGIPEADRAAFRNSGLAHLLAIAGLHIAIVMGLVFGGVRLALALWERAALHWPIKQAAALAALAAGGGYMLLTGAHVPIIRSFAMACLLTLGVLAGRRALSLRGLALAMAAIVLIAPNEVLGVSFQMSFSAVLALIAGYEKLRPWLLRLRGEGSWRRRLLGHVVALALTSALAGTFSGPFAAYHFGQIQLYNVAANMAAVPLTALWVMPAGLIALALMPLHLESLALAPMSWGISAILWIGRSVSSWPDATVSVPHMPGWGLAVVAGGLAWCGLWRTRLRWAGALAVAIGLASPAVSPPPDLLVSADARLIGLRGEDGVMLARAPGASNFTLDAWKVLWRAPPLRPMPGCGQPACALHGDPAVLLLSGNAGPSACVAALLVSAEPIRLDCDAPRIDRFSVWRDGAHAVWFDPGGVRVLSDRANRGSRPWVLLGMPRNRAAADLPQALPEKLPPG
jgi:competence protein ComEC